MRGRKEGDPALVADYATLADAVHAAMAMPSWNSASCPGDRFCGGSHEDARRFALEGWPEGARLASDKATRIADRVLQSTSGLALSTDLQMDATGAVYDVGGYLSGNPECWIRPEPQITKRAISIAVNLTVSCGISTDVMRRRGIAITALVMALQAKGYPVTVDLVQALDDQWGTSYGHEAWRVRITDASSGSPLDVDRLAYAMAHPTMFRRVFRALTPDPTTRWDPRVPCSDSYPDSASYDLKLGGVHLAEVERWQDGGEAWIVSEFNRQTEAQ